MTAPAHGRCVRAFTLVEMLIVLGIVSVLIGILLPTVTRARAHSRQLKCMTQMRQLATATLAYAVDHHSELPYQPKDAVIDFLAPKVLQDTHPHSRSVLAYLVPYLNNDARLLVCPDALDIPWEWWQAPNEYSDTSYLFNAVVFDQRLTRLRNAPTTVLFQEDRYRWRISFARPMHTNNKPGVYAGWCFEHDKLGQEYTNLHPHNAQTGVGNLVFADGHVESRMHRTLRPADFGLTGGASVTGRDDDPNTTPQDVTYLPIRK